MPFSQSAQLSAIMGHIENLQPQSILDVGIGFGQYGFLARTNLEHLNLFEDNGATARKRDKSEWKIVIDGIEAYEPYITPVQEYAYNELYIGDALQIVPELSRKYNLILVIDILEHFDKADGQEILKNLKLIADGQILISTPKEFIEQEIEANPYENHRSLWSKEDLEGLGFTTFLDDEESWIAVYDSI